MSQSGYDRAFLSQLCCSFLAGEFGCRVPCWPGHVASRRYSSVAAGPLVDTEAKASKGRPSGAFASTTLRDTTPGGISFSSFLP